MDRTGSPPETWFLCMCYVAYIFNWVSDPSLKFWQPHLVATGCTMDISPLLTFSWMKPVYYKHLDSNFSSDSLESLGYFVGFSEHVGHLMTFKIWNRDTNKILDRSAVWSALQSDTTNFWSDLIPSTEYVDWLCAQISPPPTHLPLTRYLQTMGSVSLDAHLTIYSAQMKMMKPLILNFMGSHNT